MVDKEEMVVEEAIQDVKHDFIDLVACTFPVSAKKYLFIAPSFSGFETGDEVVVQDANGKHTAIVLDSVTVIEGDNKYRFIVNVMGATVPLCRIVSRVVYREINWEDK